MTILCLGCSWTDKYHKNVSPWPEVVESQTGEKVVNLGRDGSGNRYAYDQFLNYIRTNEKPSAVYWLMTEFDRIDCIFPSGRHGVFTIKTLTQGKNKKLYLERWERKYLENNTPSPEVLAEAKARVERDSEITELIAEVYDPLDFIDHNLHMLYMVQVICEHYNIKLRVGMALLPLQGFFIDNMENKEIGWGILRSKYSNKLKKENIIGWPFYSEFGGMTGNQIKNWGELYGIAPDDNHPNQEGSNLLASFFLEEKNIRAYK